MLDYIKDIYSIPYVDAAQKQFEALIELQKDNEEDDYKTGTVFPRQAKLFKDGKFPLYRRFMPAEEFLPLRKGAGIIQDVQERLTGGHDYSGIYLVEAGNILVQEYFYDGDEADGFRGIRRPRFEKINTQLTGITLPECTVYKPEYFSTVPAWGFTNSLSQIKPAFEAKLNKLYTNFKSIAESKDFQSDHPEFRSMILSNLAVSENIINNCQIFFLVTVYSKGYNPDSCGFRYHKEGAEYFGSPKFEPKYESFMDDVNQTLYQFQAYMVPKNAKA